jgi:hypothetical protein
VTPFAARLRAELLAAAERGLAARRHRRRVAAGGMAAAVLGGAAAALLVLLPHPTPAAADVVVRISGGTVTVTLVDLEHRPERIEAAVRAAGLAVEVRAVPVGPSNVGRFVGQESSGPLPPELEPIDATAEGFRGFALPAGWPGELHLLVGTPARAGEGYAVFSDATQPGEPLACQAVAGRSLGSALPPLRASGLALRGLAVEGTTTRRLAQDELEARRWARWVVEGVDATSARELVVRLVPPGSPVAARPSCPGVTGP